MKDELVRAMTKDGWVKAVAITSTGIVERARQIHKTLPTATAALGRLLSAASMMGNMQKIEDGSITLQVKGGGPLGTLLAVSDAEGNVRGWVENPQISLMEKHRGKLDVGAAVGTDGTADGDPRPADEGAVCREHAACDRRDRRGHHGLISRGANRRRRRVRWVCWWTRISRSSVRADISYSCCPERRTRSSIRSRPASERGGQRHGDDGRWAAGRGDFAHGARGV